LYSNNINTTNCAWVTPELLFLEHSIFGAIEAPCRRPCFSGAN
jgi:hypothetical protein